MEQQKQNVSAFTCKNKRLINRLVNKVTIHANGKDIEVFALWDTGATNSCISYEVAKTLNLVSLGLIKSQTAAGDTLGNLYMVDIKLPNNVTVTDVRVMDSEIGKQQILVENPGQAITTENLGLLIGMDIITLGDFCVSNHGGKTVFSFRVPSFAETDYVQQLNSLSPHKNEPTPNRNDPCPCGSGKKYKNCCGKR